MDISPETLQVMVVLFEQMLLQQQQDGLDNAASDDVDPEEDDSTTHAAADTAPELSIQLLSHHAGPYLDRTTLDRLSNSCREAKEERKLLSKEIPPPWPNNLLQMKRPGSSIEAVTYKGDLLLILFAEWLEDNEDDDKTWLHLSLQPINVKIGPIKVLPLTSQTVTSGSYDINNLMVKMSPDCKTIVFTFIDTSFDVHVITLTGSWSDPSQMHVRSRIITSPDTIETFSFAFSPNSKKLFLGYDVLFRNTNIIVETNVSTLLSVKQGATSAIYRDCHSLVAMNSFLFCTACHSREGHFDLIRNDQIDPCLQFKTVLLPDDCGNVIKIIPHPLDTALFAAITIVEEPAGGGRTSGQRFRRHYRLCLFRLLSNRPRVIAMGSKLSIPGPVVNYERDFADYVGAVWFPDGKHIALILDNIDQAGGSHIQAYHYSAEKKQGLDSADPNSYPALLVAKANMRLDMTHERPQGVPRGQQRLLVYSLTVSPDGKSLAMGVAPNYLWLVSL